MLLALQVNRRELDLKLRESRTGGSISSTESSGEKNVHIPKGLVPSFVVMDDIDNWFKAYEVALSMHKISKEDWGLGYGNTCPPTGRDTLLSLNESNRMQYVPMIAA